MDFANRGMQSAVNPSNPVPGSAAGNNRYASQKSKGKDKGFWSRIAIVTGIACVVIILIGVICIIFANNNNTNESQYVYKNKLQAVFLDTGQVYFGKVTTLNNNFFVLKDIFYLQSNSSSSSSSSSTSDSSSSSSNNVSLVKLGCELHMPYDEMVINRSSVTFWENLQSGGQVAKAVASWQSSHPNGQTCSTTKTNS